MPDSANDPTQSFTSKLEKPAQRFLAHVIEHCFSVGRRSAADFTRHFTAKAMMTSLERRPDLRADILVPATGVNHKVALRKSAESSGEDLQIALDEGVTTSEDIVKLFRPDDRVRYLDNRRLWTFVTEGEFWKTDKSKGAAFDKAKDHIAYMLDRALADGLLSHSDLIGGVSVSTLAQSLSRQKLGEIIEAALAMGRDKKAFTERTLFDAAASAALVADVPLVHIWESVITPKIAEAHGLVDKASQQSDQDEITTVEPRKPEVKKVAPVNEPKRTKPAPGPAPGMPVAKKTDLKDPSKSKQDAKKEAKKPAKKAKSAVVSGSLETKPSEPVQAAPAGLEELLVDVDDFEIEEIEEEFPDQATAT